MADAAKIETELADEFDFKNPNYLPVYLERARRLKAIRKDPHLIQACKVHYKHNPVDFINDWMMTVDPRREPANRPFILWPKQREYIEWLKDRYTEKEDGLVEKSRDAGATYLNCAFAVWLWVFYPGSKVSFGSRKEDLVDKIGNPDSIFQKIRNIISNLPVEFQPREYNERQHAAFMRIVNPDNGATITGESGDNIGRGGRSGLYFKDESAFYERPELIDAALSQNSDVKIDVSTPNGNGNPFYRKRFSGKIPIFVFDWRDDPRKDDEWYQKQADLLEPWILAQEVDRDYNASAENICIPSKYVQAAVNLELHSDDNPVAGLDVSDEGDDAKAQCIRRGPVVSHIEQWKEGDTTETTNKSILIAGDHGAVKINYDSIGVGAGVKAEYNRLCREKKPGLPIMIGVNVGLPPTVGRFNDRPNKEMFLNLRAELTWKIRQRFERTYERVKGIKFWPDEDCISIPNHPELISEISRPKRIVTDGGKIQIESKKDMKKRGIPSTNLLDSVILAFYSDGGSDYDFGRSA